MMETRTPLEKLTQFDLDPLFVDDLGWDRYASTPQSVSLDGVQYVLQGVAEKRGMVALRCEPSGGNGELPSYRIRRKLETQARKVAHEHIVIYSDSGHRSQVWQWVKREPGRPVACREHVFTQGQTGEGLLQKLRLITFELDEEEDLTIAAVAGRVRRAFDVDRVTKRFYDRFQEEHGAFLGFIEGIEHYADREWYASVMLNRLMFVYFIQKKGFLDNDPDYLRNRLQRMQKEGGNGRFFSFYRYFLIRLFHEGLGQQKRSSELDLLLGNVPYLNGGLFDVHELEEQYTDIDIPDDAFGALFDFFDAYQWHLDERPLRADNEINPDVLGYIFEKYVNQKQMGAYYTKEDITEFISRSSLLPTLFKLAHKRCPIAFDPNGALWRLLQEHPTRYLFDAALHGITEPLPDEIAQGVEDTNKRSSWNQLGRETWCLPNETWREHVARRHRAATVLQRLSNGEITSLEEMHVRNLNLRQFAQDAIEAAEGPELVRAMWESLNELSVLDPACGSGAFLFAALNTFEPLYDACLERMAAFLHDAEIEEDGSALTEKFVDFKGILADVEGHPNRRYFILKSIVIRNLFGVDIMQEAVEICKLRLFLKLVAQVSSSEELEPLPDIDFNVRPGNSLVGFTSLEDARSHLGARLDFEGTIEQMEGAAAGARQSYVKFRDLQTGAVGNQENLRVAKEDLKQRLGALNDTLDGGLAAEYGVRTDTKGDFTRWRGTHQPFHWIVDFYGVLEEGGFHCVIGNPPYVEYSTVRDIYTVPQSKYSTEPCANLFALFYERAIELTRQEGRVGLIIPVASVCTGRYAPLQKLLARSGTTVVANFNDRPSKLFDGLEHIRLSIIIHENHDDSAETFSTGYLKWKSEERSTLFQRIFFVGTTGLGVEGSMPKLGSDLEVGIWSKLQAEKASLAHYTRRGARHRFYYTRKMSYFIQVLDFIPKIIDGKGKERAPSELKTVEFDDAAYARSYLAGLNSCLFYWFLSAVSDCRNLNKREIYGFPFDASSAEPGVIEALKKHSKQLMHDIDKHSKMLPMTYKRLGTLKIQCTFPRFSKQFIDLIDQELGTHFGFTDEELDFLTNYDIKYRMGSDVEEDEALGV